MKVSKLITAGAIVIFLFSLCLMPSCNPTEEDINTMSAITQETLMVVDHPIR